MYNNDVYTAVTRQITVTNNNTSLDAVDYNIMLGPQRTYLYIILLQCNRWRHELFEPQGTHVITTTHPLGDNMTQPL